jgi:hypothetical protein
MTHSVDEKNAQRAACGICARSGSIEPVKIILEFSDRKDGAGSKQANRDKRQQEAANSSCTKTLGSCHEVKFSSEVRLLPYRDVAPPARFPARFSFGAGASEGAISLKAALRSRNETIAKSEAPFIEPLTCHC